MSALLLALWLTAGGAAGAEIAGYKPVAGDIVFQSLGGSPLTDMIEGVTRSGYSHCGIVAQKKGGWSVIEAIGPVREIPLGDWIRQGQHQNFAAYRLKPAYAANTNGFVKSAETYLGRPYDIHYAMDDEKIYCSELVFKAYRNSAHEDLGHLVKLKELNWKPHADFIRQIEGGTVPLEREIITPANLAKADQLECVYSRGMEPVMAMK